MERRTFLRAGAASALAPAWIGRAFGQEPSGPSAADVLADARERAARLGKPLLVFVVPHAAHARTRRGEVLGALLENADEALLADLALVEVACVEATELTRAFPTRLLHSETVALLVEPDSGNEPPIAIEVTLGEPPEVGRGVPREDARYARATWVLPLATALRTTIAGDHDRTASRLAAASRVRLLDTAPAGARWGRRTGCGVQYDGEEGDRRIACGRGHVPAGARRFLDFYSRGR